LPSTERRPSKNNFLPNRKPSSLKGFAAKLYWGCGKPGGTVKLILVRFNSVFLQLFIRTEDAVTKRIMKKITALDFTGNCLL
jgi:hypothetical protein